MSKIGKEGFVSSRETDFASRYMEAEKMNTRQFPSSIIHQQSLKPWGDRACPVLRLPVDICCIIFTMYAEGSEMKTANLMLVCHYWQAIVHETPALCRRLILTGDTPQKFIKAWSTRNKHKDTMLRIYGPFTIEGRRAVFKDMQWDRVRSLTFVMDAHTRLKLPLIPDDVNEKLKPEELCFCRDKPQETEKPEEPALRTLMSKLNTSHLKVLLIKWPDITQHSNVLGKLPTLTVLRMEYDELPSLKEILSLLNRTPSLEELTIKGELADSFGPFEEPVLSNLRSLCLKGWDTCFVFKRLCLPNVECVALSGAKEVSSTMRKAYLKLKSLRLDDCDLEHTDLLKILKRANHLEALWLKNCNSINEVNAIIEILGKPKQIHNRNAASGSSNKNKESDSYICPGLQHLRLHSINAIEPSTIRRLLKSRLKDCREEGYSDASSEEGEEPGFEKVTLDIANK